MIRKLKAEDKDQYIEIMKMFIDERMGEFDIEFCDEEADAQFDVFFNMKEVVVLVAEDEGEVVGAIAGIIGPMLFCKGKVIQEMVWYVKKDYRKMMHGLRLIKEFERESKELGCSGIIMVGMNGDNSNDYYIKAGYKKLQKNYYKRF
jgi:L-amino acid N-acyltransferase YncA